MEHTHAEVAAANSAVLPLVRSTVQRVLGQSIVADDQPLMEAGLDSLGAVELHAELGTVFQLEMPATLTFDYPTIAALATYIVSCMRKALPGTVLYTYVEKCS